MKLRDLPCTFCRATGQTYQGKTPKAKFFVKNHGWSPDGQLVSRLEPYCAGCGRDFLKIRFSDGKAEWIAQEVMDL